MELLFMSTGRIVSPQRGEKRDRDREEERKRGREKEWERERWGDREGGERR